MSDLVGPILEVIKFIGSPAIRYLNYHRKFNKHVDDFEQAQAELRASREDIQQQLQDEHCSGKKRKREVEIWLEKVEEELGRAQRVEAKVKKGKYLFRSCLGKLADEATQALKDVKAEGHFSGSLVVNDPSIIAAQLPTQELAGETNVKEEIYNYLMGDEVRMIGVCGMGGIGKTTIMKHVHNRLVEETKFSKLIWVTVSQDFDIRRLQNNIASQLKDKLSDEEDTITRAAKLSEMLRKQGRYVLIMDDVWSSLSLENIGILEPTPDNGCKLVLTTRTEEVVRSMGCKKVQVPCLSTDEAWRLFLSKVGRDMLPSPTLETIMKDIVGECGGLPLAIVTVAGCMRGISDPLLWENALNELRGCIISIQGVKEKVFGCLKFSYDHLRQIDRDCFLCCALYPEDYEIKKEEIIEYWMEEGLIAEMGTRKAMEGCGLSILQKLAENCLLEWVWEGSHIKMHDVVRDMALDITKKGFLVKAGKQLEELPNEEEWTEDLEKVSLMYTCISSIPPNIQSPKFQKLTTLLLSANSLEEIPESFFAYIPNLKILDLSNNPLVNLPNSISNLENLNALMLHGCCSLEVLPSLSKLLALKKLDLGGTLIKEIPQGLEMLVNLRYLNLRHTKYLEEIPNGLLPKLCRLQYLAIYPASTPAKEIRELNKLEVFEGQFSNLGDWDTYARQRKRLHKYYILVNYCHLEAFEGWFSNLGDWNTYASERKKLHIYYSLVNYCHFEASNYSKIVAFGGCDINSGERIILPYDIQRLEFWRCKGMRSLNDIFELKNATDLKQCRIRQCEELESIFSSGCQRQTLESLDLSSLENLKVLVEGSSVGTFSSLKKIRLSSCGKIKNLFSAKLVLHNLEVITVGFCDKMEEIIVSEEEGMGTIKYTLPKLRELTLQVLPELKSICSKNGVMVCDSLESIVIWDCPKLKRIPLYLPLLDNLDEEKPSPPPPPLKEISVHPKEWWESLEWDHPHAKTVLLPFLEFLDRDSYKWKTLFG
ncbi:probable disease resistance protein At4g27220 [Durio zibethinus]|uniref:Probable disease resistance protein At4g27220 n=1 Tax=Durio zibethinus TaxID=66656 RepID=A0A6P5Y2X9_DURZI|nr:probable disease resistance protein At4g27220 [Durio zibethinus]XP_022734761.1 probable disease resistance protein At4g27220 [Durio zibethinus]